MWPMTFQMYEKFLLVLIRVSAVLFMMPFFNAKLIPLVLKAGMAMAVTIVLMPVLKDQFAAFPDHLPGMLQLVIYELIAGMVLGLMVQLFFEGVRMMGQLVGFQTGLAITNIIDPHNGSQVSILSNMAYMTAITLFILLNGHHILLHALKESFDILPMGSIGLDRILFHRLMNTFGDMFVLAVKIGSPAIAVLLFVKVVFGLITKLMPQMNIMIVAFPAQIILGLIFFGICLNTLLFFMERYLEGLYALLIRTITLLGV